VVIGSDDDDDDEYGIVDEIVSILNGLRSHVMVMLMMMLLLIPY